MTSPLLAIATGALTGALNNRATDAQRKHDAEAAELRKIALLQQAGYSMRPAGVVASAPPAGVAPAMPAVPSSAAGSPVLSAAMQAITAGLPGAPDAGGMAPADDPAPAPLAPAAPTPAAPPAAAPLPPLHQTALAALSAPPAPNGAPADMPADAPPAAAARRTVPVNLPGLPPMEFDLSEAPETKEARALRLKQEAADKDRARRVAIWQRKVGDPAVAEILADRPELYQELTTQKPETQAAYFDRLVARGMAPEDAAHLSRMRFQGVTPKEANAEGAGKEPNWQVLQTDNGVIQVNPKTGETRPVQGPGGAPLGPKVAPAAKKMYADVQTLGRKVDQAITLIQQYPDAVGFFRGRSDAVDQRYDPQGVAARAALADLTATRLHDLSGNAVTTAEAGRFKPYLPQASDNAKTVLKKLKQLRAEVTAQQLDYESLYPGVAGSAAPSGADVVKASGITPVRR